MTCVIRGRTLLKQSVVPLVSPLYGPLPGPASSLMHCPPSRNSDWAVQCSLRTWKARSKRSQLALTDLALMLGGTSLVAQRLKHLTAVQETWVRSLSPEDPQEKEKATHSSILAWRIPWREEPGRLQSMGSQRVGHDWATWLHFTGGKKT